MTATVLRGFARVCLWAALAATLTSCGQSREAQRVEAQEREIGYVVSKLDAHPALSAPDERKAFRNFASKIELSARRPMSNWQLLKLDTELTHWFHDAHTMDYPYTGVAAERVLPIAFYWAPDGLAVIRTAASPKVVATGDRVLAVSGVPYARLRQEVLIHRFFSGNSYFVKDFVATALHFAPLLHWLGLVHHNAVTLRLQRSNGSVYGVSLRIDSGVPRAVQDLRETYEQFSRRYLLPEGLPVSRAPWSTTVNRKYGFFLLTTCVDTEAYQHAVNAFFASVAREGAPVVVLDLQGDGGGDATAIVPWLAHLPGKYGRALRPVAQVVTAHAICDGSDHDG